MKGVILDGVEYFDSQDVPDDKREAYARLIAGQELPKEERATTASSSTTTATSTVAPTTSPSIEDLKAKAASGEKLTADEEMRLLDGK